MKRWIAMLLAAPMLFSCAMAETGGLDLNREVKPATAFTAKANAAVYDELDFSDKQEYAFATRGLIDAPETLELKDEDGRMIWSQDAFAFLNDYEKAPDTSTGSSRWPTASIRCAATTWPTSPSSRVTRAGSSLIR